MRLSGVSDFVNTMLASPSATAAISRMPSEAGLRGHLKGETKDGKGEGSGSSNYVPKEAEKDAQLQYALKMLRGEPLPATQKAEAPKTDPAVAPAPQPAPKQK